MPRTMIFFRAASIALIFGLVSGCSSTQAHKNFPALRDSRPLSILVMPPVNRSMDISAPAVFLATSTIPLAESGYYVIPVAVSHEMFIQNGVHSPEDVRSISYGRLREIFGADAALYITVTHFGVSYQVVRSVVQASASARLVDLRTGQELWSGQTSVEQSSGNSIMPGGNIGQQLLGMVIEAAVTQVINAITNPSYGVGKEANYMLLSAQKPEKNPMSILYGPYHPGFGKD